MRIGIKSPHTYGLGGGFSVVWWFLYALRELKHDVVYFKQGKVHPIILNNWFGDVPIVDYQLGVERGFDVFISISHFDWAQPLAQENMAFVFFPQIDTPPPEGVRLYTVSQYCANHVKHKWGRDAEVMYIPIKGVFRPLQKEKMILHVSRFTEPSEWADKAHRQMIQVFKMYQNDLQDWQLVMAGALDPNMEDYFNELTYRASSRNILFYVNPTDLEMANLYGRSSFYWHATGISLPHIPSAQEHLGLAPLEAQAAGCVPVVFNSGGMPEVVIHGKTGALVDDARQLGKITVDLSHDWSAWSGLSQQGMRWARRWQDFESFKMRLIYSLASMPIPSLPDYEIEAPTISDVQCVIPTYNNNDMLKQCLDSLMKTAPGLRVLIINNGDPLPSWDYGEMVTVANMESNLGFGGALRVAESLVDNDAKYILLLNDDTLCSFSGWLSFLLYEMAEPTVGITGPKLLFGDGRIQFAGGAIDFNRDDVGYHIGYGMPDSIEFNQRKVVPFVTGAAMLLRRELFHLPDELLNGLNYEDPWLCLVAAEKGYQTTYQPASALFHLEGITKVRTLDWKEKVEINKAQFIKRWRR